MGRGMVLLAGGELLRAGLWLLGGLTVLALLLCVGWGIHRFLVMLENQGYIYYRQRPAGGGSGPASLLMEIDRIARPSIQYTVEVEEESRRRPTDTSSDPERS
ncbi:MAG: hypothetical protein FJ295_10735 [Planctomycetes bacterium]|nr:hypothetical protein [Planctomycetota bacterium]